MRAHVARPPAEQHHCTSGSSGRALDKDLQLHECSLINARAIALQSTRGARAPHPATRKPLATHIPATLTAHLNAKPKPQLQTSQGQGPARCSRCTRPCELFQSCIPTPENTGSWRRFLTGNVCGCIMRALLGYSSLCGRQAAARAAPTRFESAALIVMCALCCVYICWRCRSCFRACMHLAEVGRLLHT